MKKRKMKKIKRVEFKFNSEKLETKYKTYESQYRALDKLINESKLLPSTSVIRECARLRKEYLAAYTVFADVVTAAFEKGYKI
jgi:hypothetical protein